MLRGGPRGPDRRGPDLRTLARQQVVEAALARPHVVEAVAEPERLVGTGAAPAGLGHRRRQSAKSSRPSPTGRFSSSSPRRVSSRWTCATRSPCSRRKLAWAAASSPEVNAWPMSRHIAASVAANSAGKSVTSTKLPSRFSARTVTSRFHLYSSSRRTDSLIASTTAGSSRRNGRAGDRAVDGQGYGLVATDLIDELPGVLWTDREG